MLDLVRWDLLGHDTLKGVHSAMNNMNMKSPLN